jgi:hypothetical protein
MAEGVDDREVDPVHSWRTMKLRHLASDDRKLEPSRIRCAHPRLSVAPGWAAFLSSHSLPCLRPWVGLVSSLTEEGVAPESSLPLGSETHS